MPPRNRQRYVLDCDDLLNASFLTSRNANNLINGLNASANVPLATSAGGTGAVGPSFFKDGQLLRYSAALKKILSSLLVPNDLSSIAASGDLTDYYPGPSVAPSAITYPKIGTDNNVTTILNTGGVLSVAVTNPGSGYTNNAIITISQPSSNTGIGQQATVNPVIGTGATGTAVLSTETVSSITLTAGGTGYVTSPLVTISGGGGTGATATATVSAGAVTAFVVTNAGSGYTGTPTVTVAQGILAGITGLVSGNGYTTNPTVTIVDGGGGGTGVAISTLALTGSGLSTPISTSSAGTGYSSEVAATVSAPTSGTTAVIGSITRSGSTVTGLVVSTAGSGYSLSPPPTITITDGGGTGTGAWISAEVGAGGGVSLSSVMINAGGSGYSSNSVITANAPPAGGSGATAVVNLINSGSIAGLVVTNGGSGYTNGTTITLVGGGGSGALILPTITGGAITSLAVRNGGSGYTSFPTVQINNGTAQITATLSISGGVIGGLSFTNVGGGYNPSSYVIFTITDPGAGGSGATLAANITPPPVPNDYALLGAATAGSGDISLQWFPPPNLNFLSGQVAPTLFYDATFGEDGSTYQYYTVPAGVQQLQIEIYGAGGAGNGGATGTNGTSGSVAGSGTADGGGGGGGAYAKILLSAAGIAALTTLDGKGQIKMLVGQSSTTAGSANNTTLQFNTGSAYNFVAGGGGNGAHGDNYGTGANGTTQHPTGGVGGVPTYGGVPITSSSIDANCSVPLWGSGGSGFEGGNVNGTYVPAAGAHYGDGGVDGLTYRGANSALPNSSTNILYQDNSSKSNNEAGGDGATPGNGGGGGRNGNPGGYGGAGRVIITAFVNSTGGGTTKYLLVPKVLGAILWSGSSANLELYSNIMAWGLNNTSTAGVPGTSGIYGTMTSVVPPYTLAVQMITPFAFSTYAVLTNYGSATTTIDATFYTRRLTPIIVSPSLFYIALSTITVPVTGISGSTGTGTLTNTPSALPGSTSGDLITFAAYGPQ